VRGYDDGSEAAGADLNVKPPRRPELERLELRLRRLDDASIDELYGLEPVFEPDAIRDAAQVELIAVACPYCWETYQTRVDLSAGSSTCVEDCQVCCQPIELSCDVDDRGRLRSLRAERMD
jgi:hypothetical protein